MILPPLLLLLLLCLVSASRAQMITFGEQEDSVGTCVTVSGETCEFPFIFRGISRTGCIRDPEGKLWCNTRVGPSHCQSGCPEHHSTESAGSTESTGSAESIESTESTESTGSTDRIENTESIGSSDSTESIESIETVESTESTERSEESEEMTDDGVLRDEISSLCFTQAGEEGKCQLPVSCIGASIQELELNKCELSDGSPGTCCVPISLDNIINIIDTPRQTVSLPGSVDINQANDILIRSSLSQATPDPDRVRFASEEPAEDVEVDINFVDDPTPANFHLRFNTPRNDIINLNDVSNFLLNATKTIKADNNLTDEQTNIGLRSNFNSDTSQAIKERCPWEPAPTCNPNKHFRSWDGTCNNLRDPNLGRTGTPYQRIVLPEYARSTLDLPRRSTSGNVELPSARSISNALSVGEAKADGDNTILVMQMGQFIDHDITHTPNHAIQCCGRNGAFPRSFDAEKCSPIRMFRDDPFWKGRKTCMNFARSLSSPGLKCELSTREQLNQITHWLDGSNIYGSTISEAMHLRADRGKLKISRQSGGRGGSAGLHQNLPSCEGEAKGKVTGCDVCGKKKKDCFFAGDFRVNEQLNLIVMHTLFMREHNRIATQLATINPSWSDERIYQEARKINIAEYQHIILKEWLPIIIGKNFMKSYGLFPLQSGFSTDYADNFDPRINNEFAAAAFRFGHSMVPPRVSSVPRRGSSTVLQLSKTSFSPAMMKTAGFLDGLVRGMAGEGGQLWDNTFVDDLRNHLFESSPGRGGLDLVAVNIQRGRDHGLPGYNKYREICTGHRAKDWSDLRKSIEPQHIQQLKSIYRHVDDVDLYVGGFLEAAHEDSILGPVFKCIIGDQFARLKKGDRFFYDLGIDENIAFSLPQLNEVRRTSMARIICDNTDEVDSIQPLAFKMPTSQANVVRSCSEGSIPRVNLEVFKSPVFFGR